ncbi:hypothetical protein GOQ27_15110 [Clostridium sp. D2Q-11]|uniref:Uncharacterized protein n=1 Tax=Anaeromonas frigoriresistens TaxID=2683708 RepID=A0A942V284_9FIRM|nr:hypothetical protein [Anaeromonas frigoriresistens]MBS4539802.1 hypothetical protein [Anaeromonas frigoriresistens]
MRKKILIPGLIILYVALVYNFTALPYGLENKVLYMEMKSLSKEIQDNTIDSKALINTYISKYYIDKVDFNADKIEGLSNYDEVLVDTAYLMLFNYSKYQETKEKVYYHIYLDTKENFIGILEVN